MLYTQELYADLRYLRLRTFVFACVVFLRLLRCLRTFYFDCKALRALRAMGAFEWEPPLSLLPAGFRLYVKYFFIN